MIGVIIILLASLFIASILGLSLLFKPDNVGEKIAGLVLWTCCVILVGMFWCNYFYVPQVSAIQYVRGEYVMQINKTYADSVLVKTDTLFVKQNKK